ncbi:MAG: RHS repeat-associated core domain-containing protein [Blastomonas sp.]
MINIGRFQYTGQTWLDGIGLYYYKARMYSPTLGRPPRQTPSAMAMAPDLYAYVGGDPINFIDPLGLNGEGGYSPHPPLQPPVLPRSSPIAPRETIVVTGTVPNQFFNDDGILIVEGSVYALALSIGMSGGGEFVVPGNSYTAGGLGKNRSFTQNDANVCSVAYTPDGDSWGQNPKWDGGRYNSSLQGDWSDALKDFTFLVRASGEQGFHQVGPSLSNPYIRATSYPNGSVTLRQGVDFKIGVPFKPVIGLSPRIDIKAGAFGLRKAETVHYNGTSRQCIIR